MILFSLSNNASASAFATSVLPTPVGPKNKNEPIGLLASWIPALCLKIAFDTSLIAWSCPITLFDNVSYKVKTFSLSPFNNLLTGMPVFLETIFAISSSSTTCEIIFPFLDWDSSSFNFLVYSGISPYWISLALL